MSHLLDPITPDQWDARKARHLLSRAGFGEPISEIDRLAKLAPAAAVDGFLQYEKNPEVLSEPDWMEKPGAARAMRQQADSLEKSNLSKGTSTQTEIDKMEEQKRQLFNQFQAKERQDVQRLKLWWLRRMYETHRPLQEKMTLFWHGHFATSAEKVKSAYENYQLNKLLRDNATGNFKKLVYEVGISPAMLRYLDNDQNNKRHPNENWAREVMELFTLGKGNYTEDDIKNSARAFTGWTSDGENFVYNPALHDEGQKTFFGKTGNFNGNDIIDLIFEKPAAARFISRKLWLFFAYDDPEDEVIDGMAKALRGAAFDLKPALKTMFLSRAFYGDRAIGTQIKSPVQLAISMMASLEVKPQPDSMVERYMVGALRQMGQDLLFPPNVKGWDGGKAWINTNTLMTRYNLADFLISGVASDMGPGTGIKQAVARAKAQAARAKGGGNRKDARLAKAKAEMAEAMAASGETAPAMMMDGDMEMGAGMEMDLAKMDMREIGIVGDTTGPKGIKLPIAPFDAEAFFSKANGVPVYKVVDFLADYFYGRPIADKQRAEITEALAGGLDPATQLDVKKWDIDRLRSAARLMLSAAEFQLC